MALPAPHDVQIKKKPSPRGGGLFLFRQPELPESMDRKGQAQEAISFSRFSTMASKNCSVVIQL